MLRPYAPADGGNLEAESPPPRPVALACVNTFQGPPPVIDATSVRVLCLQWWRKRLSPAATCSSLSTVLARLRRRWDLNVIVADTPRRPLLL